MRRVATTIAVVVVLAAVCLIWNACRTAVPVTSQQVDAVTKDLSPWVDAKQLQEPERKALGDFCRFLATRRWCDDEITSKRMTDEAAVKLTQPMLDKVVKDGKPAEDVLIRLLDKRKGLDAKKRNDTLLKEDPEIYATIILWNMKSKRAVPLLIELAKDKTIENRAVFVRGLGRIGDPAALDFLNDVAAKDLSPEVQNEAKIAIEEIERANPAAK